MNIILNEVSNTLLEISRHGINNTTLPIFKEYSALSFGKYLGSCS